MPPWNPRVELLKQMAEAEAAAAKSPTPETLFRRAALLHTLGKLNEAKAAYVEALKLDASHHATLTQLGALLRETSYLRAAATVYRRLIALDPRDALPHTGLAHTLWEMDDHAGARAEYEAALALDPACVPAHQGLAAVFSELKRPAEAAEHARLGYAADPVLRLPYRGEGPPLRVLVLASAGGGNTPLRRTLDDKVFAVTCVAVEHVGDRPLPRHDIVWNAVGEADRGGGALAEAQRLTARLQAPVINAPARVAATGRGANARRLAGIEGLIVPRAVEIDRRALDAPDAVRRLLDAGLRFPMLLRATGFHAGAHFERLDGPQDLGPALRAMPGDEFLALELLDARGADGKIRKYRILFVDGRPYPLHAAVSQKWKVHYFSADMASVAAHRAEDRDFLEDPEKRLGPRAWRALQAVAAALGLDYAGIDFSLARDGSALFFEANATMVLAEPDGDPMWDYRRAPVARAQAVIFRMPSLFMFSGLEMRT